MKAATFELHDGEKSFNISLTASVTGKDAKGMEFQEATKIESISSETAVFYLRSSVLIGSELSLSMQIPKTLILENPLDLLVRGHIIRIQDNNGSSRNLVTLRLKRSFRIQSLS